MLAMSSASLLATQVQAHAPQDRHSSFTTQLQRLEEVSGGRLGVCFWVPETGASFGYRDKERFALCSTFKLPLAAAILSEIDAGRGTLDTWVPYSEKDLVNYAPVTKKHLEKGGMTLGALAGAAQKLSDNVAANLLLKRLGGPVAFTQWLRRIGDTETRLDRYETELNLVPKGELRDTTTPKAMAQSIGSFVLGSVLLPKSVAQLRTWLEETKTGARRLRAGLPKAWPVGNKTGTGIAPSMANKYNDVAVVWPADRPPFIITAYLEAAGHFKKIRPEDEAILAEVGRIGTAWFSQK